MSICTNQDVRVEANGEGWCEVCEEFHAINAPLPSGEALVALAQQLEDRICHVATLLGWSAHYYSFEDGEVSLVWEETWSYGGHESHSESFPLSYLSMSDEDIMKTEAGKKELARQAKEKRDEARELKAAEQRVREAKMRETTAQARAAQERQHAEATLRRLQRNA